MNVFPKFFQNFSKLWERTTDYAGSLATYSKLAPRDGLEPPTKRLTDCCFKLINLLKYKENPPILLYAKNSILTHLKSNTYMVIFPNFFCNFNRGG